MPLIQSGSNEARSENIATEVAAGKDPKQAAAIAYSTQRANAHDEVGEFKVVSVLPEGVSAAAINARNRRFWIQNGGETQGASPDESLAPWGSTQ